MAVLTLAAVTVQLCLTQPGHASLPAGAGAVSSTHDSSPFTCAQKNSSVNEVVPVTCSAM